MHKTDYLLTGEVLAPGSPMMRDGAVATLYELQDGAYATVDLPV